MHDNIKLFLKRQTCTTICCLDDGQMPYCFSCFYAFNSETGLIYFKSSVKSHHYILLTKNPGVAGTVLRDKLNKLVTKGIQWTGNVLPESNLLARNSWTNYHKQYPMAIAMEGDVITVRLNNIKMTDSTMGFGKKIIWDRMAKSGLHAYVRR